MWKHSISPYPSFLYAISIHKNALCTLNQGFQSQESTFFFSSILRTDFSRWVLLKPKSIEIIECTKLIVLVWVVHVCAPAYIHACMRERGQSCCECCFPIILVLPCNTVAFFSMFCLWYVKQAGRMVCAMCKGDWHLKCNT